MDHREALELMATERYLLDEFPPETREQFEEHLFSCRECALDVRMTAAFIEQSKKILSMPEIIPARPQPAAKPKWAGWFRPSLVIPAFALLLVVIAYQALVVHPALSNTIAELQKPAILSSTYLSSGMARGEKEPVVMATPGQPFILFVDIPSDSRYTSYSAELLNPGGAKVWQLDIPAAAVEAARDSLPIRVVPVGHDSGEYVLVVRGLSAAASQGPEIARYAFNLQLH